MENNYFTNKEIILGLRDDFIYRYKILQRIKQTLIPLERDLEILVSYDNLDDRVDLEANYKSINKDLFKNVFHRKYIYEAMLTKDENEQLVFEDYHSSFPNKRFPIMYDDVIYNRLSKLYNELLANDYPISIPGKDIFGLYNSLVIYNKDYGINFDYIEYNPEGDLLTINMGNNTDIKELLSVKHHKGDFTTDARLVIENNLSSYKPMRIIGKVVDNSHEQKYELKEREHEFVLTRKLTK